MKSIFEFLLVKFAFAERSATHFTRALPFVDFTQQLKEFRYVLRLKSDVISVAVSELNNFPGDLGARLGTTVEAS